MLTYSNPLYGWSCYNSIRISYFKFYKRSETNDEQITLSL